MQHSDCHSLHIGENIYLLKLYAIDKFDFGVVCLFVSTVYFITTHNLSSSPSTPLSMLMCERSTSHISRILRLGSFCYLSLVPRPHPCGWDLATRLLLSMLMPEQSMNHISFILRQGGPIVTK